MAVFQIKDCNGKEFTIDDNTFKFTGDLNDSSVNSTNLTDSARQRINFENKVDVVDSKGNILDANKLLNDIKNNPSSIAGLLVDIEATHSGKNHNFAIYYEDSMEKDAESFLNPFNKPMLMNHDEYCEPIGRIVQSYAGQSDFTDERSAIIVKAKVTDSSKYDKFLDGRYRTVSIGGTMGTVTCSICGKTILKNNKFKFCGHWRGETYKDEVCYWGARDIEYNELSVVNNPADDFAQIKKITVLSSDDKETNQNQSKEENSMEGNNAINTADSQVTADKMKESVCNLIDSMLGSVKDNDENQPEQPEAQPAGTENQPEQPTENASGEEPKDTEKVVEEQNAKIQELEKQIKDSKTELETLKTQLEDSKKEFDKANEEIKSLKDKCISLAELNKNLVVDSIIEKEKNFKILTEDKVESRKEELLKMSMVELNAIEVKEPEAVHDSVPEIQNPSLADTSKDGNSDTADSNDNSKVKSIEDYTNEIIDKLSR